MSFWSLLDYKDGFGGKFGVQKVQDKSAVGWDHQEAKQQHDSQKGESVLDVSGVFVLMKLALNRLQDGLRRQVRCPDGQSGQGSPRLGAPRKS